MKNSISITKLNALMINNLGWLISFTEINVVSNNRITQNATSLYSKSEYGKLVTVRELQTS